MALVLPVAVSVLIPATSANLGPGFDSLGLALQLYNRFEVEESRGDPLLPEIEVGGKLGEGLPTGPDNLFFRSFVLLFGRLGVPVPAVRIRMTIHIPHGCGLGSSATAVVGGLMAANELIGEAMQDRLHQPYRQALFPAMPAIIQAAVAAGAHGACLSGGGSSLIALASSRFHEILNVMQETARDAGVRGTGRVLRADQN